MKAFPSACGCICQYPANQPTTHTLLKSPVSPNIRLRGALSAAQILWWAFVQGESFIPRAEGSANKQADTRQSHLGKTLQMYGLMLLCKFYHVSNQKYPTWAEYPQVNSSDVDGLLGCPLRCKSQLAAFYNGSPGVTFSREPQMATMWEGHCAFDAICIVINSVLKKKKDLPYQWYIVLWCLVHKVWFWGLADYLHMRLPSWRARFGLISGEKSKPELGALLRDEKWIIISK